MIGAGEGDGVPSGGAAMKIEFISDVVCPWCAIGLHALERALARIGDGVAVDLHFRAFELNPDMAREGEDLREHLVRKYGLAPQQLERSQAALRERGAAVGFEFGERSRIWNTFDAHRLVHWAGLGGRQREMKHALLRAYHTRGENIASREVLVALAQEVSLDPRQAGEVLDSGAHGDDVRHSERRWQRLGIQAVPSLLVDGRHLIQGGHPPEVFEQLLRQLDATTDERNRTV